MLAGDRNAPRWEDETAVPPDDRNATSGAGQPPSSRDDTVLLSGEDGLPPQAGPMDETAVLRPLAGEAAPPVFVDETGRRNRRLRFGVYAAGLLCLIYAGLVAISLAGGAVGPDALLPFPDLIDRPAANQTTPPTPAPSPSSDRTAGQLDPGQPWRRQPGAGQAGPGSGASTGPTASGGARPAMPRVAVTAGPGRGTPAAPTAAPSAPAEPAAQPTPETGEGPGSGLLPGGAG